MLPGKKFTPEDILLILYRKIWILLVPFAVISAATAVYVKRLPDLYRSDAILEVVPPRVPEGLITSAPAKLEDRLPAITQQVLSRTRLERIIIDLDLYPNERRMGVMEDVVEQVRNAISVTAVRGNDFQVSYIGGDPRTVMKVTDRITSQLLDEAVKDRESLLQGTDQFLEATVEGQRRTLIDHEQKLADYRKQHNGELPTQIDSNLQSASANQLQAQGLMQTIDHDRERRLNIERQISELENGPTDEAAAALDTPTARQFNKARDDLSQMLLTKSALHPDVQAQQKLVHDLEARLENESLQAPLSTEGGRNAAPAEVARQRKLADLKAQDAELETQLTRNAAEVKRLQDVIESYLKRAEMGPTRDNEMTDLNRDYSTQQGLYTSLLQKKEEASLAANLESRQIGQQFKILDSAQLPSRPFSPDRRRLYLLGMVAGLGVGLGIIALLEYRNMGMQTDDELTGVLSLPVLAVVPVMESDRDRRRRTRWRLVTGSCLGGVVLGCLGILAYAMTR